MSKDVRSIKMPGSLLDQIKQKEDKGDYDSDKRYKLEKKKNKKRKLTELGRKEKRKEERRSKKLKGKALPSSQKNNGPGKSGSKEKSSRSHNAESDEGEIDMNEEGTWAALKALKQKKNKKNDKDETPMEIDLNESDEAEFSGISDDEEQNQPQTVEDTMAALKALKQKMSKKSDDKAPKKSKQRDQSVEDTMAQLKALKAGKMKGGKNTPKKVAKSEKTINLKTAAMREDEAQMEYYAKKLGMSKKDKLRDEGDGLDSLLDGLDFDFDSEKDISEDDEDEEVAKITYSDDEINSSDFDDDDDLDSAEEKELRALESVDSGSEESKTASGSDMDGTSESDLDDEEEEHEEKREKENPYAAPTTSSTKYVPPALRRRMQEESNFVEGNETEEVKRLKKSMNSSLNKLSEANFISIVNNELNKLYYDNPRQVVTEALTERIIHNIKSSSRLLDSFVIVYAGVISAFYRLQGVEFAAYLIQKFVETLQEYINNSKDTSGKELTNLISLFGFVYNMNVFSSNLIFDIIKMLCEDMNEVKIEMLLKLVMISGQKMRHEDPTSLKDIITLASKSINGIESSSLNARAKFLLETLQNVKNNKFKNNDQTENNAKIITSLKKQLQNLSKAAADPIQVTLNDIRDIKTKGKWWLVGSAWKGNESKKLQVNEDVMSDILDSAEPNWSELADFYRMNTSVRKAVFIAIMSSEGFEEAALKIAKLGLKGKQKYEVPKILLICCSIEPHYNPFYGYVAKEFCTDHDMKKTFQFNLWDLIKEFEGTDGDDSDSDDEGGLGRLTSVTNSGVDEESNLKKILSLGKLYGFLMGQGALPLTVLKTVNFVTATQDTKLFLEIALVTFLDNVGKLSEISVFGTGSKKTKVEDMKFDDKKLLEKIPKGQPVLLRGLQYFLQQNVRASEFITGRRQTRRVEWGCDTLCDVIDEFLSSNQQD